MSRLALALLLLLAGCGGSSVTGPSVGQAEPPATALIQPPAYFEGFYFQGQDAPFIPGNGHIAILSWGKDVGAQAAALRAKGAFAFVSVHCCLWTGGRFDPSQWDRIEREWLTPYREAGVLAGVYLIDESAVPDSEVAAAAEFVESRGYPTMATRHWAAWREGRLPGVTWYSVVTHDAYGIKKEWVRDFHREADTDWIVGQAYVDEGGYERGMPDQAFWRETARIVGKPIISWVWSWPGQIGCADDSACAEVWR